MRVKKVVSHKNFPYYDILEEVFDGSEFGGEDFTMKSAYSKSGVYIGDSKTANRLVKKYGITHFEARSGSQVCSVGYSSSHRKWYGWSHRAIFGFKPGSKCKKGMCHYHPDSFELIRDTGYFGDECHMKKGKWCVANEKIEMVEAKSEGGLECLEPKKGVRTRGKKLCKQDNCVFEIGRGEWEAKTWADAKQMAIDFAEGVS